MRIRNIVSILSILALGLFLAPPAKAAVVVTAATGGAGDGGVTTFGISAATAADQAGATWTNLTNIVITEGAAGDIGVGNLDLSAPAGFQFNGARAVDVVITGVNGLAANSPVTYPNATTMRITVTAASAGGTDVMTIGGVTSIQVQPTVANPIATGQICKVAGGSAVVGVTACGGGQTNFGTLNEVPGPIANLACVPTGTPGTVRLSWTDPAGDAKTGYDVRYSTNLINAANYAVATNFVNAWPAGVQGTARQELVTGLNPNFTYFFAVKSNSANGLAAISSTVPNCVAPTQASPPSDAIPASSSITDPQNNATILVGQDYTIKGTSLDEGGSSVQKVEISFDGGSVWVVVIPTVQTDTGFNWSYVWRSPAVGTYNIKTRATDWFYNREVPGQGITVNVASQLPIQEPPVQPQQPAEQPAQEKPIIQMTVEELQVKIAQIQRQIVVLLQQLIQKIQEQIIQLLGA